MCPKCRTNELQPRWRVCEQCLSKPAVAVEPVQTVRRAAKRTGAQPGSRDVVLACGHVIASRMPIGEVVRCPLHRDRRAVDREWDGEENPEVAPMAPPPKTPKAPKR